MPENRLTWVNLVDILWSPPNFGHRKTRHDGRVKLYYGTSKNPLTAILALFYLLLYPDFLSLFYNQLTSLCTSIRGLFLCLLNHILPDMLKEYSML